MTFCFLDTCFLFFESCQLKNLCTCWDKLVRMADPPNNEVLCNLAWLTRLDVLDHLPLPVLEQITTSVPVPSSSSSTLDGLLGRPGVLQEVQLALQSTSMSHM